MFGTKTTNYDGNIEIKTGIDPIHYSTITCVCIGIFKTLFLTEEYEIELRNKTNDIH